MLDVHPGGRLVGHDGSMPGFMASLQVDPDSGIGAVVLTNATTGIAPRALAVSLIEGDPDASDERPAPWRPTTALPARRRGGAGGVVLGQHGLRDALAQRRPGAATDRAGRDCCGSASSSTDGVLRGVLGYHRGERLDVVRRPGGSISHLECATFVYTRTPYDPYVDIPGGHPRRLL